MSGQSSAPKKRTETPRDKKQVVTGERKLVRNKFERWEHKKRVPLNQNQLSKKEKREEVLEVEPLFDITHIFNEYNSSVEV